MMLTRGDKVCVGVGCDCCDPMLCVGGGGGVLTSDDRFLLHHVPQSDTTEGEEDLRLEQQWPQRGLATSVLTEFPRCSKAYLS